MAHENVDAEQHKTSLAVWDVASPLVIGRSAKIKVGAKCSAGCQLTGHEIEIHDQTGITVARAGLGAGHFHNCSTTGSHPDNPGPRKAHPGAACRCRSPFGCLSSFQRQSRSCENRTAQRKLHPQCLEGRIRAFLTRTRCHLFADGRCRNRRQARTGTTLLDVSGSMLVQITIGEA